jgi:putative ABC transport system permease protein
MVIVIGIAGVVGVLTSFLAMATGFQQTVRGAGRADRAVVLRGGSNAELSSTITRDNALTILDAPGVKHDAAGHPIGSAEIVVVVERPLKSAGTEANVTLRGIGPQGLALRPEVRLIEGRMYTPGLRELVVGQAAHRQFDGLDIGNHVTIHNTDWTVVGIFGSHGDTHESEILSDAETTLSAFRRTLYQSVTVMLDSPSSYDAFKTALTSDPQLSVEVRTEPEYLTSLSESLAKLMTWVAQVIGGIMAIGAVFGALNTMYSAVSTRTREIATLRAIGFGATPVVISVLVEALGLSLLGGAMGAALSWLFFNGNAVNTLGGNFTQIVFRLTVTPALIWQGIIWACCIGLVGGLFPSIRAARLPVATALRAT